MQKLLLHCSGFRVNCRMTKPLITLLLLFGLLGQPGRSEEDASTQRVLNMTRAVMDFVLPEQEKTSLTLPPLLSKAALASNGGFVDGELAEALEAYLAKPEATLGFDPLIDAQDFDITDFTLESMEQSESSAWGQATKVVQARFRNFGEERRVAFAYIASVDETQSWKLFAVFCLEGHEGREYSLTDELLRAAKE